MRTESNFQYEIETFDRVVRFVGFDLDGTLIDTMDPMSEVFGVYVNDRYKIDSNIARRYFKMTLGTMTSQQVGDLVYMQTGQKLGVEELIDLGKTIDYDLAQVPGGIFLDVIDALNRLKAEGYRMFISSSHNNWAINKRLVEFGLRDYFNFIVGKSYDRPEFTKGEPHFRVAANHFNVRYEDFKSQTVYIGDSERDIQTAVEAGVIAIGRSGVLSEPEILELGAVAALSNFKNLPSLLASSDLFFSAFSQQEVKLENNYCI